MKLVIGTANLGMNYGAFNNKKINKKEFRRLEKLILTSNISFIDTAISYGESENILGKSKLKNLKIITKIKLPKKNIDVENWVFQNISKSLRRLRVKSIYGLLVHDYKDLLQKKGNLYLTALQKLKKNKIVKKIGISIYEPQDINKFWKFWKPDIIQTPLNPLDTRIIDSGWLNVLKKFNVKVFARSIFLQGLLINKSNLLNIKKKKRILLYKFQNWCCKNDVTLVSACINFVKQFKKIDYIIVGFDKSSHLKEIINVFKKKSFVVPKIFSTNQQDLIDPRKWKIKRKF